MVFEADLAAIRSKLVAQNYIDADADLLVLIDQVETLYAGLSPGQQVKWEDTRLDLKHIKEHLRGQRETGIGSDSCIAIIDGISTI